MTPSSWTWSYSIFRSKIVLTEVMNHAMQTNMTSRRVLTEWKS